MKVKKAWAITDRDGRISNLSVSVFDTKKEAQTELEEMKKLPAPFDRLKNKLVPGGNKIIKIIVIY